MGSITNLLIVSLLWSFDPPTEREDGTILPIDEISGYSAYIDGAMQSTPIINTATTVEYPDIENGCLTMRTVDTEGQASKLSVESCTGAVDIPPDDWTIRFVSSWESEGWQSRPEFAFNRGNPDELTLWHSRVNPTEAGFPHRFQVDMGQQYKLSEFGIKPRASGSNAVIQGYEFRISEDGQLWRIITSGEFPPGNDLHTVEFDEVKARYFYFVFTSNQDGNNQQVSIDEIYMTGVSVVSRPNPPIMVE